MNESGHNDWVAKRLAIKKRASGIVPETGKYHGIRTEDPGVKKARIELCQHGILKGDRCADIPPTK